MPNFAANLSFMFQEMELPERYAAAAAVGFRAVEFLFPYDHEPALLAERREAAGLSQALFNVPPGDWQGGERGITVLPGREGEADSRGAPGDEYGISGEVHDRSRQAPRCGPRIRPASRNGRPASSAVAAAILPPPQAGCHNGPSPGS